MNAPLIAPLPDEPEVTERAETPCVSVRRVVTMSAIAEVADQIPRVIRLLAEHGVAPAGPPFLRYLGIDMAADMVLEAGVPVDARASLDGLDTGDAGEVTLSTLPGGRFVTLTHHGHPDTREAATADLLAWAAARELDFDVDPRDDGEHWACRIESYLSDPREVPDLDDWDTELAFKLR